MTLDARPKIQAATRTRGEEEGGGAPRWWCPTGTHTGKRETAAARRGGSHTAHTRAQAGGGRARRGTHDAPASTRPAGARVTTVSPSMSAESAGVWGPRCHAAGACGARARACVCVCVCGGSGDGAAAAKAAGVGGARAVGGGALCGVICWFYSRVPPVFFFPGPARAGAVSPVQSSPHGGVRCHHTHAGVQVVVWGGWPRAVAGQRGRRGDGTPVLSVSGESLRWGGEVGVCAKGVVVSGPQELNSLSSQTGVPAPTSPHLEPPPISVETSIKSLQRCFD